MNRYHTRAFRKNPEKATTRDAIYDKWSMLHSICFLVSSKCTDLANKQVNSCNDSLRNAITNSSNIHGHLIINLSNHKPPNKVKDKVEIQQKQKVNQHSGLNGQQSLSKDPSASTPLEAATPRAYVGDESAPPSSL